MHKDDVAAVVEAGAARRLSVSTILDDPLLGVGTVPTCRVDDAAVHPE